MANINVGSVLKKMKEWEESDAGQAKINREIYKLRREKQGIYRTEGGSNIVTIDAMHRAAQIMIKVLQETASAHRLPASVLDHFNSLEYNAPMVAGKQGEWYAVEIYFEDDLSRPSLLIVSGKRAGQRTGEGIDDIVSLFNTGYEYTGHIVTGVWDSHPEAPAPLVARRSRDGLNFMEEAVSSFNRQYGAMYNVYAYYME